MAWLQQSNIIEDQIVSALAAEERGRALRPPEAPSLIEAYSNDKERWCAYAAQRAA
jgi:hypothetical protein